MPWRLIAWYMSIFLLSLILPIFSWISRPDIIKWPIDVLVCFCQLPLYLYILRDLYNKLDISLDQPTRKLAPWIVAAPTPKLPSGLGGLGAADVLKRLQTVFPSLKRHLNSAISQLRRGNFIIICKLVTSRTSVDYVPGSFLSCTPLCFSLASLLIWNWLKIYLWCQEFKQRLNMQFLKNTGSQSPLPQATQQDWFQMSPPKKLLNLF
jgi:hypothetical protein